MATFSITFILGILCLGVLVAVIIVGIISAASRKSGQGLVPCPGCGKKIPQFTETCPHCGQELLPPSDP